MISMTISRLTKSVLTVACVAISANAFADDAPAYVHRGDEGQGSFAVGLKAPHTDQVVKRHVIMVDTSASQIGAHRVQSHAVVEQLLMAMPKDHQVSLMALDVQVAPMTKSFVAPQSDEMQVALKLLNRRAPLGATDLGAGLAAIIDQCNSSEQTSVIYIGDGMSAAQLMSFESIGLLTDNLRQANATVSAYAVGPKKDINLLSVIAQQTGGRVIVDTADTKVEQVVADIHSLLQVEAVTPRTIQFDSRSKLASSKMLPLRSDSPLYLLGEGTLNAGDKIQIAFDSKTETLTVAEQKMENTAFISTAVTGVEESGGLFAGYPGNQMLVSASIDFLDHLQQLREMAEQSIDINRLDQARGLVSAIRELDPNNNQATVLLAAAERKSQVVNLVQDQPVPSAPTQAADGDADVDLVELEKQRRVIRTEQLTLEVSNLIRDARKLADTDADNALNELKSALNTVNSALDIDPEAKTQIANRLRSAIQDVMAKRETQELKKSFERQGQVEREVLTRLRAELELDEEKFQMLLERVRALMIEGRHEFDDKSFEAAESVAEEAVRLRPESGTAASAFFKAEAAGQLAKAFKLRFQRRDEFLAVLHQVELSHVPFPDEPPVRWPSAEVWQDLTERRRIWKRTNLRKNSPTEEAILQALDEEYQAEFFAVPLQEVFNDIEVNKNIPIEIDPKIAGEIDLEDPIELQLSGVSLRTILKFILEPRDLVYLLKNEVLFITTYDESLEAYNKFVYVYPVGDLVITPIELEAAAQARGGSAANQGGQQNQQGGQGGQQGGFGGQQGGQGGGFGGGGFGGGGGGFGSVRPFGINSAPAPRRAGPQQNAAPAVPQQIQDPAGRQILNDVLGPQSSIQKSPVFQARVNDDRAPVLTNESLLKLKKKL